MGADFNQFSEMLSEDGGRCFASVTELQEIIILLLIIVTIIITTINNSNNHSSNSSNNSNTNDNDNNYNKDMIRSLAEMGNEVAQEARRVITYALAIYLFKTRYYVCVYIYIYMYIDRERER